VKDYFYRVPMEHILCGFAVQTAPYSGRYIYRYAYPLYDPIGLLHPTFGGRLPLPAGFMPRQANPVSADEEAADLVSRIAPYEEETYTWGTPPAFLSLLKSKDPDVPQVHRAYAFTLVLLGRGAEAVSELRALRNRSDLDEDSCSLNGVDELCDALSRGADDARACLLRWEAEAKSKFAIDS
jgi:hypothetical protein